MPGLTSGTTAFIAKNPILAYITQHDLGRKNTGLGDEC
jgi:hypothetical protein